MDTCLKKKENVLLVGVLFMLVSWCMLIVFLKPYISNKKFTVHVAIMATISLLFVWVFGVRYSIKPKPDLLTQSVQYFNIYAFSGIFCLSLISSLLIFRDNRHVENKKDYILTIVAGLLMLSITVIIVLVTPALVLLQPSFRSLKTNPQKRSFLYKHMCQNKQAAQDLIYSMMQQGLVD